VRSSDRYPTCIRSTTVVPSYRSTTVVPSYRSTTVVPSYRSTTLKILGSSIQVFKWVQVHVSLKWPAHLLPTAWRCTKCDKPRDEFGDHAHACSHLKGAPVTWHNAAREHAL